MNVDVPPGKYVVAVSGGVDSVSLLHMLREQDGLKLTVAHYDHGIRPDSKNDRLFVQELARKYGLPFTYDEGRLGPKASEATARTARYKFLRHVRHASGARAIITAHHQDDALETAIINILRGTGRKGLTSLGDTEDLLRPLLHLPKTDLKTYAQKNGLEWQEDPTNIDETVRRNYIRHRLLPRFDAENRAKLVDLLNRQRQLNRQIEESLTNHLHTRPASRLLDRRWFRQLPHDVAKEMLAAWFRTEGLRSFESKTLERAVVAAKVGRQGTKIPLKNTWQLLIGNDTLALIRAER